MHPSFAEEWSERNLPLTPDMVNEKSRKNVCWKCKVCGFEWKSLVQSRVKGTVCPVCADRAVLTGYNDLATTDTYLLHEGDYERNIEVIRQDYQGVLCGVCGGNAPSDIHGKQKSMRELLREKNAGYVKKNIKACSRN